mmetsp:Transcript_75283/g.162772  ORF Transcript_75283/g.162772 Transcript_75283/m.162772 type:complete len:280 (+) Transcript_75283:197-1036(+)
MTFAIWSIRSSFCLATMRSAIFRKSGSSLTPMSPCAITISQSLSTGIDSHSSWMRFEAIAKSSSSSAVMCTVRRSPWCLCCRPLATAQRRSQSPSCESLVTFRPLSLIISFTHFVTSGLCPSMTCDLASDQRTLEQASPSQVRCGWFSRACTVGAKQDFASPRISSGIRVMPQAMRESVSRVKPGGGEVRRTRTRLQRLRTWGWRISSSRSLKELFVAMVMKASTDTIAVKLSPFSLTMPAHFTAEAAFTASITSFLTSPWTAAAAGAAATAIFWNCAK